MCSSASIPLARRAFSSRSEFSTGTLVSSAVCQMKKGGALRFTRFSRDTTPDSSSRRSPSRFSRLSWWAIGPLVMTGYPKITPSGRKAGDFFFSGR